MATKVSFTKLGLKANKDITELPISGDLTLEIRNYLPIEEKSQLVQYVVDNALDANTGCFSPLRIEVYFILAVCKYYASINFTEKQLSDAGKTYDLLEGNGISDKIISAIPRDEYVFIKDLVDATTEDIARYNASAAGIIQMMNSSAGSLDAQITDILEKIKNKEGLETLDVIKNAGGTD